MTIKIKNQSDKQITNLNSKLFITAPADKRVSLLNWAELKDKNENTIVGEQVDDQTRRGIISWNGFQIPALSKLKPNGEVLIDIQLPIKDAKKFDLAKILTPSIYVYAEVKYKDATKSTGGISTHPVTITLNSDLTLSNEDAVSKLSDNTEKHTVSWVINNSFHPLKDITISASAFGDVLFAPITKGAGELTFSETENKIVWSIPEMPIETDVLGSTFTLTLNKTNPTQNILLSKVHLTATDSVTGKTIDLAADEISLAD
jgi:hypothetical protein